MRLARVPGGLLRHRLDGAYYDPLALEIDARLRQLGNAHALESLRDGERPITNGVRGPDFAESPFKLIRLQDCIDWEVRPDLALSISGKQFKENVRCRLRRNDVVVAIGGYVGNAAIVIDDAAAVIGQHSARVSLPSSGPMNPRFLVAYLNAEPGRIQFARLMRGTVQQGLNLEDVQEIAVPVFSPLAQRYVGDKVRQAERLRERARGLEAGASKVHAQYIVPPTGIDFHKRTRRLPSRDLTERLDAHFYPAPVEQYFRAVGGEHRSLTRLTCLLTNGQTQPGAHVGVLQATVTNLGTTFVEGTLRTVERPRGDARVLAAHDLLLCNAAHNKSYVGRDVTYCQIDGVIYPSTEVMVIRVDRSQVPASFVRQYLKTEIGFLQIQSTIRGITAHSYPSDIKLLKIPVPDVPPAERAKWFATDAQMLVAGRCFDAAQVLKRVATALVERLIERAISETDMVAAQRAVESGDRSADRALLQALRQGAGRDEHPLFTDLDAIYTLLDDTEAAEGRT